MLIINDLIISLLIIQMERMFTFMIHNIGCLSIYAMLDYLLRYMKIKAEWAQLRAIGNGIVVACTYQDVVSCLSNHDTSWQLPLYPYAEPLVFSLYLYQCILGKMRCQDPFYHAFVLIRTPIGYMNNNKTMSVLYFFCNGYPSLIDYTLVSMVGNEVVGKQLQKNISGATNNYIRKPGAAVVASLLLHDAFRIRNLEYPEQLIFHANILLSSMVYYKYAVSKTKQIKSK